MFTHVMVGSINLERSRRFYDALFTATGARAGVTDPLSRLACRCEGANLTVTR